MEKKLIIKKKGKLYHGNKNVTKAAPSFLFDYCDFDKDITLKDIFLLINEHKNLFDMLFRNWTKELIEEGLSNTPKESSNELYYLELYWHMENDKFKDHNSFYGGDFPDFHAIGKNDSSFLKGDEGPYSLSFTPSYEILHLPIKLKKEVKVYDTDYTGVKFHKEDGSITKAPKDYYKEHAFGNKEYMLWQILYGIVYELSFHGSPINRDKEHKKLKKIVDNIASGKEKCIPFEEVEKIWAEKERKNK